MPLKTLRAWFHEHPRSLGVVYLGLIPAALIAIAVFGYYDRQHVRRQNRQAIILVARAQCSSSAVFEQAALHQAKSTDERKVIRDFFTRFNASTNKALITLHAEPCQKGATP